MWVVVILKILQKYLNSNLIGISALINLEFLYISNNYFNQYSKECYVELTEIFQLTKLKSLKIKNFIETKLTGISNLINLQILDISFCTLDDNFYLEMLKIKTLIDMKQNYCTKKIKNIELISYLKNHIQSNINEIQDINIV